MSPLEPAPEGYPIKLVRDNTPQIINSSGKLGDLFYGPLPADEDRGKWLRQKLGEEAIEYINEPGVDELIQVVQVVQSLALEHGVSIDDLIKSAQADPRGGFFECVMMYGRHPEYDR